MFGAERRLAQALAAWNAGDHGVALDLWAPLAHRGDARAQSNMGAAFLEGRGVERDHAKAVDWLRRAAEQGDVGGQRNLALCYYEGWGVEQDQEAAARWYEKAAEQGDADAQDMLSWMKLLGGGCAQDYVGRACGPRRRQRRAAPAPWRGWATSITTRSACRAIRRWRPNGGSGRRSSATPRRRRCWVRPISPARAWRATAARRCTGWSRQKPAAPASSPRVSCKLGAGRAMIVGTAGHIDHGKTALVKALTGVDADRLKEEKARGITIDLGYAYSDLGDGRQLGFVDVPGHERFVHNMLAGATGIDAALLIVSAAEGIKPQTVEHLQIIDLLGLDRGVVALTKADLADDDQLLERMAEVETLLAATSLKGAEIVPVSALSGRGVDELKAKLLALGESSKGATGFARLAVDRSFVLSGAGVVVTGTVHAGEIKVDDRLLLTPSGLEARVRSLHAQNRPAEIGRAGERCALNLAGPRLSKDAIRRGDWVVSPELHAPTDRLDVRLSLLTSEGQPMKHWSPVHVHLGAAHVMGRVALLEGDKLAPGDTALAQLVLEEKVGALAGDRVILRDPSAIRTMAGAAVIDPFGPPRNRRSERRLAELVALAEPDTEVLPKLLRLEAGFVETGRFGLARNLRPVDVDKLLQAAGGAKLEGFGFLAETLAAARKDIVDTLKAHHEAKPDAPGLQPERLRLTLKKRWPPAVFKALLDHEIKAKAVMVDGAFLRLPGHSLTLGARDEGLWRKISADLIRERYKPPRVRDFASAYSVPETEMRKLLQRLAKVGRVVEVAPDQYFLRPVVAEMIAIAHAFGRDFTAAEFRDKLDNGRKVAILILEFFDRHGITIRRGDLRRTVPQKLEQFGPAGTERAAAER